MKNNIIIISGPTATGKTSTSLSLAKSLKETGEKCAIVNFDSLLFYKELNIGTAKPSKEEQSICEHHLMDITSAKKTINASDYITLAQQKINQLHNENKIVLLVGGSGFYLRALIKGMYQGIATDEKVRIQIEQIYKTQGIEHIRKILKEKDPQSYKNLHANDHYRIIRAVEYFLSTNSPISKQKNEMDALDPYDFSTPINPSWKLFHCYLDIPKEDHYKIITSRTQKMINDGLIQEVENLLANGFTGNEKPLQSIGYKETIDFLNGKFNSVEEYAERISISTRQLAKAQRTWFKKIKGKNEFNPLQTVPPCWQL